MFLLLIIAAALAFWAIVEGRRQRSETAEVLASQAAVLARALAPGLAAASSAAREIDEEAAARVLVSARILATLEPVGEISHSQAQVIAEQNDMDSIVYIEPNGRPVLLAGEPVPGPVLEQVADVVIGEADELVLGSDREDGVEHVAAVVRTAAGGAVVVRAHLPAVLSYTESVGVDNLLRRLAGSGGLLYLEYSESPGDVLLGATWDGGPVPEPLDNGDRLRIVRQRDVFEIGVPVSTPAGLQAELRVGLDGAPLAQASASAVRRTTLVGLVLVVFSLALVSIAMLTRSRTMEREQASRRMADLENARRQSERLAAAGALTAGLAHEVRSPLNAIGLSAQRIGRNASDSRECGRLAVKIRSEIGRLETVLRDFLVLASPVGVAREITDLRRLVDGVLELLAAEAEEAGISLACAGPGAVARVDPESIRRAVINLVRNAIQASGPGGEVRIDIAAHNGESMISVRDRGRGLDDSLGDRVFDAFVTTSADGTGLGLALVKRVAEEHGGQVTLANLDDGGAVAELRLPACAAVESS